jgi:hypothetical protein
VVLGELFDAVIMFATLASFRPVSLSCIPHNSAHLEPRFVL